MRDFINWAIEFHENCNKKIVTIFDWQVNKIPVYRMTKETEQGERFV